VKISLRQLAKELQVDVREARVFLLMCDVPVEIFNRGAGSIWLIESSDLPILRSIRDDYRMREARLHGYRAITATTDNPTALETFEPLEEMMQF
jgi:hypothetical protein